MRAVGAFQKGQPGDGIDGVEQEMGVDLGLQGFQLGCAQACLQFGLSLDFLHEFFLGKVQRANFHNIIGHDVAEVGSGLDLFLRHNGDDVEELGEFFLVGDKIGQSLKHLRLGVISCLGQNHLTGQKSADILTLHHNGRGQVGQAAVAAIYRRPLFVVHPSAPVVTGGATGQSFGEGTDIGAESGKIAGPGDGISGNIDDDCGQTRSFRKLILNLLQNIDIHKLI